VCLFGTLIDFAGADIANYTTDHLTLDQVYAQAGSDGVTWGQVVDAQKLGVNIGGPASSAKYKISFPVLQYRGALEEIIPTSTEDATRQAYCTAGITTQWNLYVGDHLTTDNLAISDVITWFGQRFAGQAATGNC
jgi:triacylglycerol lipase